ncbi:uncharacterized protein [Medicago truncatula]|uniref:uncharacterized protein n=1 Tax=Medicago truncatula TaxID=3880 RepID=UPI000D2F3E82|nr:uncharacterized protein LOC112419372 [Medicago truncatula]
MEKRGIHGPPLCPRCYSKIETSTHAFMECPLVSRVWFGSSLNLKILDQRIKNFPERLIDKIQHAKPEVLIQIVSITYYIWYARNLSVFKDRSLPEVEIIQRAYTSISDYRQANSTNSNEADRDAPISQSNRRTKSTSWRKPETHLVKVNTMQIFKFKAGGV